MADDSEKKDEVLDATVGSIEKEYGEGSIMKLGERKEAMDVPAIATGALTLDEATGVGGVPRGRVTELFGPESSGKTTLALSTVAEAQKGGGIAAFIDVEHALDPEYAEVIGVDVDELYVSQPNTGEEALEITEKLVRSGALDLVVIDSVAALVPKAEIEGEMGDSHVGLQARLMSQAMRKLSGAISKSKTSCIFINQIREKIGVMYGNPETTPGGRALKFYSSLRLDIRQTDVLKDGSDSKGIKVRVRCVKNKVASPFREGKFDIVYGKGIDSEGCILDCAVERDIVERKGSWYSYGDTQLAQGRDNTLEYLKETPELMDEIEEKVETDMGIIEGEVNENEEESAEDDETEDDS
jgi:recombination protein RecA